ncbi:MAG: hypothetical protein M9938_06935 [Solirubrobacterales bacterium]|nr:hypothetical protein [Solirubrobacterales bacterium]
MTHHRNLALVAAIILSGSLGLGLLVASQADAWRKPTKRERKFIKRATMKDCRKQEVSGYRCDWLGGIKVSTVNRRFAWARASGPNFDNSGLLRRRGPKARRWHMLRITGGGIQPCSYWYAKAPRRVVRDLEIRGFRNGSGSYEYHRC